MITTTERSPRWIDRQVPERAEVFIDHLGFFVADLDSAANAIERLGFDTSKQNLQTTLGTDGITRPAGTSNRLVRFRRGFLEFLAATHDTPLADQLLEALARYSGVHLIALSHADLESERARLVAAGFDMQEMVHLRRHLPSGETVAWSVLRCEPEAMPEGRIQFAYPHTPELSWPPGSTEHPNAADAITGVALCVDDPASVRRRYARYLGIETVDGAIRTDRGTIEIWDQTEANRRLPEFSARALPCMPAISLASADLAQTHSTLTGNGVSIGDGNTKRGQALLWASPDDALGCALVFHEGHECPL